MQRLLSHEDGQGGMPGDDTSSLFRRLFLPVPRSSGGREGKLCFEAIAISLKCAKQGFEPWTLQIYTHTHTHTQVYYKSIDLYIHV